MPRKLMFGVRGLELGVGIVALFLLITYHILLITPTYAAEPLEECEPPSYNVPVTALVEQDQRYLDLVNQATIYKGINEEIAKKSKTVCTGIESGWLSSIIPGIDLSSLGCTFSKLTGIGNFCPQTVQLGKNTNQFHEQTQALLNSSVYKDLVRNPQSYRKDIIEDVKLDQIGNGQIFKNTDCLGNDASCYTAEIPREILVGISIQPLLGAINSAAGLRQGNSTIFETSRTGQYDPARCANFHATIYEGVRSPSGGVAPNGFDCPKITDTPSPSPIPKTPSPSP